MYEQVCTLSHFNGCSVHIVRNSDSERVQHWWVLRNELVVSTNVSCTNSVTSSGWVNVTHICMYMIICPCICWYFPVFDSIWSYFPPQVGLMPKTVKNYSNFPLTSGKPTPATLKIENFHQSVGLIRCFDARLNNPERRIKCDWYDRDNEYLMGAKKLPQYSDLFWKLFFLVMKNYAPLRNIILRVRNKSLYVFASICKYKEVFACIC